MDGPQQGKVKSKGKGKALYISLTLHPSFWKYVTFPL
jgi:hypothetical protein